MSEQQRDATKGPERERRELMVARAGGRRIGVFADEASGVTQWRVPTPLPHAPAAVLGVASARGRMLTILDPLALLGEPQTGADGGAGRVIIVLRGDEQLALAVDDVDGTREIFVDEISEDAAGGAPGVRGILQAAGDPITVLDSKELFAAAMLGAERRRLRS
ncbi:MAG TPA: chemotaxis protein CheW [Pyrinomonadaceae bacterium]|jgi:chemotaxis signal transduction protein